MSSSSSAGSSGMDEDAWKPIVLRKTYKEPEPLKGPTTLSKTSIITVAKAADNKHKHLSPSQWSKLDAADDAGEMKKILKTVSKSMGTEIAMARIAKGFKRQELAQAISVKEVEVAAWENGTAIFNQAILNKINKALGRHIKWSI